ncbi:MAG: beta-lactamase family protein [Verrucomicrobia bacterium]|nr:beta-lactamase family protein [Verrucomicrobiota bacterium]
MNDDALKHLWKEQRFEALPALPDEAQIAAMKMRMKGFDKTISWRDYGEVAACILIIGWFGWDLLFRSNSTLTQAGCVVLIVSAVLIAWKLIWSKRRLPQSGPNAPIFDAVKVELHKVENQIGLLTSVAWWYLLPLLVGVMICHWGGSGGVPSKVIYSAFVLALYVFIYWLNQRAVKNNLLPLKRELASLLHAVETGEPFDQTQLPNLRRTAFSLTAASQVKPVEFKVAFWQIAIYGIPGIVGIWFFGMLALTEGNIPRMFLPQHLVWVVPFFIGGLIYSWLLQKITERAVGISTLGVHLNKGQNLLLWDEIKEVRPFRLLNIRSLWLIRESGEKNIMPWTGLERQSDLKAAVETFAPANHPIRQYLSLLRSKPSKTIIVMKTIMLVFVIAGILGISLFLPPADGEAGLRAPEFDDISAFADSDIARIDAWLEEQVAVVKYPSLSVAIVLDGKIAYQGAFGFENITAKRKATPETSYHVASVTKAFTASLAVLLDHRGVIDLDQPVVKCLPNNVSISTRPGVGATITLRQLASHTSGLPRGVPGVVQSVEGRYQLEPKRLYQLLAQVTLESNPGTEELYSNLGFGLLGHALERAAGKPFDQLLQEMVCDPLHLKRTAIQVHGKLRVATGYSGSFLRLETEHSYRERLSPSGGLIASAPDLAEFLAAQMKPGLFSSEMFEELHTPTKLSDGSAAGTALGWSVRSRDSVGRILKKNGGRNNASAWIGFAPDHGVGVAVVANSGEPDVDPIGYWLLERSIPGRSRHLVGEAKSPSATEYPDPTSQMLETIRVKHNFPALAAAVVVDGKIVATNAVGFRKHGGTEKVTVNDKFHIGSVTKSMTATVAAMLVEQGKISWTTTIEQSLSNLGDDLHSDYRDVTLEQLLSHRGGAPGNAPKDLWSKAWTASGPPAEQRLDFVKGILARKPEAKPGTKKLYSNQGYSIAGVMLENAAGKPWEELMRSMLFEPLGMDTAGFGAPATPGEVDQPWGHTKGRLTGIKPVPPGPRADNPSAIGPAGTVHCSLADLAEYATFHMAGEQGSSELLNAESFKKLHTSAGDDYGLGWIVLERKWAGGRALMHNGSNTMFYVVLWMAPERNCAVVVATNVGSVNAAFAGCDEAAGKLIEHFFPK